MPKPNELTVEEFAHIISTELEAFVKKELLNQKENPQDYCYQDESPKFTNWFGDWMENFACGDCIIPENQEKIGR